MPAQGASGRLHPLSLRVDGRPHRLEVEARRTLLDLLRRDLGETGPKEVCGAGNCGACTVLLDGEPVYACLVLALECEGCEITTAAGLGVPGDLHPVQEAFLEHDGYQCGFCTPGQVVAAAALLDATPAPTESEVLHGMAGNLCRCGAYRNIVRAVLAAAGRLEDEG